jgi:hypothetical protein
MSEKTKTEPEPATNDHKPLSREEQEELELSEWCDRVRGVTGEWKEPYR